MKKVIFHWQKLVDGVTENIGKYLIFGIIALFLFLIRISIQNKEILKVVKDLDTNKVNRYTYDVYKAYMDGKLDVLDLRITNIEKDVQEALQTKQSTERGIMEVPLSQNKSFYGINSGGNSCR